MTIERFEGLPGAVALDSMRNKHGVVDAGAFAEQRREFGINPATGALELMPATPDTTDGVTSFVPPALKI